MSAQSLEALLARIYVDPEARLRFRSHPREEALKAGLTSAECDLLERVDWVGLELAAQSFERKRIQKGFFQPGQRLRLKLKHVFSILNSRIGPIAWILGRRTKI